MSTDGLQPVPDDFDLGATVRGFVPGQQVISRYVLRRVLGRGGMGVVWLAWDEKLAEEVALKFLPDVVRLDSSALDELKRETRRSRSLTHPHIVRIHDFVDDSMAAAISMEFVDGATLSAIRVEQPSRILEPEQIAEWLRQLCEALHYAHHKIKIVHRDLKPANLMINAMGDMKVADFGIARSISDSVSRVSLNHGSSGTLAYMSPQQSLGRNPSPADDIYSLGATIYELLTSKPPFYSGNIQHQLETIVPQSMMERRADLEIEGWPIPASWEKTVAACLAKHPADRPQSIEEVAEQLGLGRPLSEIRTPSPPVESISVPTTPLPPKGRGLLLTVAVVAALIFVAGLGYYFGVVAPKEQARQAEMAKRESIQKEAPQTPAADSETDSLRTQLERAREDADAKKASDAAEAALLAAAKREDVQGGPSGNVKIQNAPQPGQNFTASNGMEMVWVPPLHGWVGKFPVTQDEYQKVMGNNPSQFKGSRRPVEEVTWNDAMAYCNKLSQVDANSGILPAGYKYSLPSDDQYSVFVGNATLDDAVTSLHGDSNSTATVGSKGANQYGLYDTRGNVWEWCLDWYTSEINARNAIKFDSQVGEKFKVVRGGSWCDFGAAGLKAGRSLLPPENRDSNYGFRCVVSSGSGG